MIWLIAGLPIIVMIATGITLALAGRAPAEADASEVRRIAQVQVEDLSLDREAARRGLQAEATVDPLQGRIVVRFGPAALDEDTLELRMLHPVSAHHDRMVTLHWKGPHWQGRTAPWTPQAWELRLKGPRGQWRLLGRIPQGADHARLVPAVPP